MTPGLVQVEKPKDSELTNEEEAMYLKKIEWLNNHGNSDQDEEILGNSAKSNLNNE